MAKIETKKETTEPTKRMAHSRAGKAEAVFYQFQKAGAEHHWDGKKKENSAAMCREVPRKTAPRIVAPDRDVPGNQRQYLKIPMPRAVL